jgi:ATP-dependent Clp protease ATP-binding subunit ClpX
MSTELRCTFCNKGKSEVRAIISGSNGGFICDECVELCVHILAEEG